MAWKVEYDPNNQFMMIDPSGNVKVLNGTTAMKTTGETYNILYKFGKHICGRFY